MQFDFRTMSATDRYKLLIGSVVPRPIALVTTVDKAGIVNAAPFSFFNVMGNDPPALVLGIDRRSTGAPKDTTRNIRDTGEFVVNLVDEALAEAMNVCAIDFPEGVDELTEAALTAAKSQAVTPPRISEAPVAFECKLLQEVRIGQGSRSILIGEIVYCHVRDGLVDERLHVDPARLKLVGRLGGSGYATISDRFNMPRIDYRVWEERKSAE
jgi:flavin reductase (DIM6/NTAB) family NADH-FMN oxidoreductase RutF